MSSSRRTLSIGGVVLDGQVTVLIVASTLLLTAQRYRRLTPWLLLDLVLFFFIAPMLIILLAWRERPSAYGLRLGNWKLGLLYTLGGIALMTPILWFLAHTPSFTSYYGGPRQSWGGLIFENAVHLWSWEFFFRGFMLFGLLKQFGNEAILLQAVPFAIAHITKPEVETLSTIFGGAAFGYVALRTNSMLYPFLIHWYMQALTTALASGMI